MSARSYCASMTLNVTVGVLSGNLLAQGAHFVTDLHVAFDFDSK